jgi:ATP/maltotriose-dependent transcriptional regulator MalT
MSNVDAIIDTLKKSINALQNSPNEDQAIQVAVLDASIELGRNLLNNIERIADALEELAKKE